MSTTERKNEIFGQATTSDSRTAQAPTYDVPVETVPLPSQGKVYPQGSPLCDKETVDIRSMTAREEDILTSRALIKKGTVMTELVRSCLHTPGVDVDSLLAGDRNAIMIAIRITGYGAEYNAEIQCKECGEKSEAAFNLSELGIKNLSITPVEPGQNLFEVDLPKSKAKVRFKFLTGYDENDILLEAERRKKVLGTTSESLVTSKLQRSIVSVSGVTDKSKLPTYIRNMSAFDSRFLRKYMEENEPGVDLTMWAECRHCNEKQEVQMPIGIKFFWPDN